MLCFCNPNLAVFEIDSTMNGKMTVEISVCVHRQVNNTQRRKNKKRVDGGHTEKTSWFVVVLVATVAALVSTYAHTHIRTHTYTHSQTHTKGNGEKARNEYSGGQSRQVQELNGKERRNGVYR